MVGVAVVGLTATALWNDWHPAGRQAATVALGSLTALLWYGAIRDRRRIIHLVGLVQHGTRTIQRGTALAEFTSVQREGADVIQQYAENTTRIATEAIRALNAYDHDAASAFADRQLDAVAGLEEHLPDIDRAARDWVARDQELRG